MNRRERVLKAIQHQETDFVPYNFHAVPSVWQKVRQHYGFKDNHEAMEFFGNHIVKVGSDFNYNPWASQVGQVQLTLSGGPVYTDLDREGGLHRDEFGCVWDRRGSLPHPVAYPLAEKPDLDSYKFPDPYREGRFDQARELVGRYRGQVFLFGKLGMCLFERAWSIRGMTQLLMDMIQRPEFVEELAHEIPFYRVRHAVKPGMAGWGLVKQGYGASKEDALLKLQYDLYYIKHQSLWLDTVILLKTIVDTLTFRGR